MPYGCIKLKFSSDKYLHQRKPFSKYISSKRKKTGNRKKMNILLYIRLSKLRSFYKSLKRGLFKDTQCIMVKYGLWKPNVKLRRTWCYDKWYLRKRVLFLLTSLFIFFFIFFEKKKYYRQWNGKKGNAVFVHNFPKVRQK